MRLPIRLRLTLAFAAGMTVVLASLGGFLYVRLGAELQRSIDVGLRSRAQVIQAGIEQGSFADQPGGLIDPDEAFAQVLDTSGAIQESSPSVEGAPLVPASVLSADSAVFLDRQVPGLEDPTRLLVAPASRGGDLYVVVGATLSDRAEALHRLLILFALGGPVALVVVSAAGWVLAGAALRPVERMREEAAAISASEPDRRLPLSPAEDELRRLAATLNAMLDRLQGSLAKERRFVDDASHELRTPLAILKGELDLALSRDRSPVELQATLKRASSEADRLAALAEDLLVLARAEDGLLPVHREPVSLARVIEEAVGGRRARTTDAGVEIAVDARDEIVRVDPVRLRQAIENLLDNATRYTPAGGTVRVGTHRQDGLVQITVEDSGPGFSADVIERAFEPFTHEPANADGVGLGLAIVRAVAASHGGTAMAENLEAGGARVTLTLQT